VAIYQFLLTGMDAIEPLMAYVRGHVDVPDEESCLPAKVVIMEHCMKVRKTPKLGQLAYFGTT
jgi:hypothetical protein